MISERLGETASRRLHKPEIARATRAAASILVLALSGCITQPPRPVYLDIPARPVMQPVKAADLQCLAPGVYTTIVNRERDYKTWGLELEAIIEANNAEAKP